MTLREFRGECLKYPHLRILWDKVAGVALNTQTRGLPLALRVYRGEELSHDDRMVFEEQRRKFDVAVADLKDACKTYRIEVPDMNVGDVCTLYS